MNSTNMPDNFLTQRLNVEEQLQGGWHYSAAQYSNTFMVEPHAHQMPYQICCTDYLHSAPSWLPFGGLHHYGQFMSQWFYNSQGMVYHPAYPYYGYQTSLETSHEVVDATSFHYQTLHQPNFASDQGINDDVSMVPSFVEVPHLAVIHTGGLDLAYNLSTRAQVPAHLTYHDLQRFGDRRLVFPVPHPSLPEVTSPEDISEIHQRPVEPVEFGDACADTGSMRFHRFHPLDIENHSSQHVYPEACTEHFPERAEFCDGPVSAASEAPPTMNLLNSMCQANPDFHNNLTFNNWSGSAYPTFPEVASLEDNTSFFQCENETYQPPVEAEFEEASVDLRSMGFHPWATQDHHSDSVDRVASRVECSDGLVLTTEAASNHYDPLCPTNTDFEDLNNWSISVDPMFPEVTSLGNSMMFLQCDPEAEILETYLPPAKAEFAEACPEPGSMGFEDSMDYKEHFPERAQFCDGLISTTEADSTHYNQPCLATTDFKDLNLWSDSLEDTTEFFKCEPETEISMISQPPVEVELGEACADTESMRVHQTMTQDHFSDHADLVDGTEHFQERAEFCDGPVSTTEAITTQYDQPCHAQTDFKDLNIWSDSLEPTCPEVTALDDTTELFQCEPEAETSDISQLSVKPEFGEACAETGSMTVHHTMTQDHFSDHADCTEQLQERAEFCDGIVPTTEAAKTTNPDLQNHNNESGTLKDLKHPEVTPLKDTMSLCKISQPPVEESEPMQI
ncbi:uncharacterized protein LOC111195094 [Astyanax mexicanus]|uniref:uncharacterized protein LOC111195094 n=1 Tax=Astyanax mexicanus TaxID=7994 RepID=UPI0020CB5F51|nr:uncharacterized protein LOC111195094 [Astyanax mexicanus]